MTQDPQLSADKVAELEHKLADAAAEVAKVQAELAAARTPTAGAAPTGTAPGTPIPGLPGPVMPASGVPYGGTGPHAITINGQQVTPGSGDLTSMLQQFMGGVGGGSPVVMVNGQTVSGGQPVDLSTYLTPDVAEKIRASLSQLGLDHQLGAMFGAPLVSSGVSAPPAEPEYAVRLADPPRHVPLAYRLATFDLSAYELFMITILTAAPVAVWIFLPDVVPAALVAAVLVVGWFRGRRYRRRIGMLKWGRVATVAKRDLLDVGTYYGGMTYNNMRKRRASGWDASTIWYSGPAYTNKVDYNLDGVAGSLTYRGLQYTDGVVLADSRDPSKAMTVSQFPYSVKPGPDGQLTGALSAWLWGGIIATLVVELTLVYLAAYAVLEIWVNR